MKGGEKMHRKDYILIAKCLKRARSIAGKRAVETGFMEYIISDLCSALKLESSSFNEQKFRDYIEKGE